MGRMWTEDQLHAIEARGGSVLVSAAAGSGKTAVLVERLIRRITDRENPVDAGNCCGRTLPTAFCSIRCCF